MADLTPDATDPTSSDRAMFAAGAVAVALIFGIVAVGLTRMVAGWWPIAPDDARYLLVGISVLDGHGAVTPSGEAYVLRSPVFGVLLALGSRLVGGDPVVGARLIAGAGALLGLVGALRLGWLVAGPVGAAGTAVALVSTSLVWQLLPSLRIDLPQAGLVVLLLLAAWRPTARRWAAAGVVLGLAVLVKETALPLILLPLALAGSVPGTVALRLAATYGGAALVTAGWWWIVVWTAIGEVFPLNALAEIEARDVGGSLRLSALAGGLVGLAILGWAVVFRRAGAELGPRLLSCAAIGLAPAAIYAASQALDARNFASLAVLSSVAIGVGIATVVDLAGTHGRLGRLGGRRRVKIVAVAAITLAASAGMVAGQVSVARAQPDRLTDELVDWIGSHVPDGGRIVMSFRGREVVALRRSGNTDVRSLPVRRLLATDDPSSYLWIGLRDAQLFGYTRRNWEVALTDPPAAYLIVVRPHPFAPVEVIGANGTGEHIPGLTRVATLEADGDRADILRVDPAGVVAGTPAVPLHLSADAALAWLALAMGPDGNDDAVERLLAARPVVSGTAVPTLVERLGPRACAVPGPAGTMVLTSSSTCPA